MIQPQSTRLAFVTFLLRLPWICLYGLGFAVCWSGLTLPAQDEAVPTLRVNVNLVQIPVLVLTPAQERLHTPIAANRFFIRFGDGPPVRPRYVRMEGDDPIDLAIVLDTRSPQADLLPKINQEIADLAPPFLHANDRVSIYAIHCAVLHSVENVPAEPNQLKNAVDVALSSWTHDSQNKKSSVCSPDTRLWDDLAYMTNTLSKQPGRRVVLAVTNGDDTKSKRTSVDLAKMAQTDAVTFLGLYPSQDGPRGPLLREAGEDHLSSLCDQSGGIMLNLNESTVAKRMQQFTGMLRERYILEFPRPDANAGSLKITVGIDGSNDFIRPAGNGVPVADPIPMSPPEK